MILPDAGVATFAGAGVPQEPQAQPMVVIQNTTTVVNAPPAGAALADFEEDQMHIKMLEQLKQLKSEHSYERRIRVQKAEILRKI